MLHPFISVPQARPNSTPLLALSASVHVALLCAAVWSTGLFHPARLTEAAVERIRFAELPVNATRPAAPRRASRRPRRPRTNVERVDQLPPLLTSFELVLPDLAPLPDFRPRFAELELGETFDFALDVLHLGIRPTAPGRAAAAPHEAYDENAVDRIAAAAPTNPKPRYPSRMRARGIETSFVVYFVVDTTGAVDAATLQLPSSVETDFTTSVAEVLARWHFVPAELAGRIVRQRMMQPFFFRLAERQYSSIDQP